MTAAKAAGSSLAKVQEESEDLKQQLAETKMTNVELKAELDALKNQKPDTSAADALKDEIKTLKAKHVDELKALEAETKGAAGDVESLKIDLEAKRQELETLKKELDSANEDVLLAQKEHEAHKNDADAKIKNHQADYNDMYENMTTLVEDEQKKTAAAQKEAADAKAKFAEFEAQLKLKEAEIAEVKVSPPHSDHTTPAGQ